MSAPSKCPFCQGIRYERPGIIFCVRCLATWAWDTGRDGPTTHQDLHRMHQEAEND